SPTPPPPPPFPLSLHDALPISLPPGITGRVAPGARKGPRISAQGRRLHRGRDPDMDRVQARERDPASEVPAEPVRVRPLLRHLRSEEHTSELQSRFDLVCRLLL